MPFNLNVSRCLNNKANSVHDKALNIVDSNYQSTCQELLYKDAFLSVHHGYMQTIATELDVHIHGLFLTVTEKFSNSTDFYHVTSEHKMDFSVEFFTPRKYERMFLFRSFYNKDQEMETRLFKTYLFTIQRCTVQRSTIHAQIIPFFACS